MDHGYHHTWDLPGKQGQINPDIDAFEAMMMREERAKGFFVAFGYTQDAMREIGEFFKRTGKSIVALTVRDILDEQIAARLA